MGRVSTCQKNCNTIDLRRAQVNDIKVHMYMNISVVGSFEGKIFPKTFKRSPSSAGYIHGDQIN